jgi:translation initiation factor 2A
MANSFPILASRGVNGLHLFENLNTKNKLTWDEGKFHEPIPERLSHRAMQFTTDGKLFAYVNESTGAHILDVVKNQVIFSIPLNKTSWLQFSPNGKYICLQQPLYAQTDGSKPPPNVTIWSIENKTKINEIQHAQSEWNGFIWAPDDSWYGRIAADQKSVLFFEPDQGAKVQNRIVSVDKSPIKAFALAEGKRVNRKTMEVTYDPLVSIFTPEFKSQPARVRVYKYPDFDTALASKSFFKAEDARLYWSSSAASLVVLASTQIDKSGQSYYGSTQLHHLCARGKNIGETAMVPLDKEGPCYDVAWQPNREAFCVVYGFMPSTATIFSSPKLEKLQTFKNISKNQCLYSPGSTGLLALCGFGNLGGKIDVWQLETKKKVCEFSSPDTTQFEWAADGYHFVAATTSPRLRTDNRIDIVTCTGKQNFRLDCKELWEVCFQPRPELANEGCKLSCNQINESQKVSNDRVAKEKASKFVPPAKRAALAAQQEKEKAANAAKSGDTGNTSSKKTLENKAKALKKKMTLIKKLKKDSEGGTALNADQKEKIKNEKSFQAELDDITAKLARMV